MRLNVGDRVRFLNESIEGVVSKVLSNNRVEIITSEGFVQAAAEEQLVRVDFSLEEHVMKDQKIPEEPAFTAKIHKAAIKNPERLPIINTLKNDESVYAAVRLVDEGSPLTSDIEVILVNNCTYAIAYSLSKKLDDLRNNIAAGLLHSREETFMGIFSQDELHRFNGFILEALFFRDKEYAPRSPLEKHFSVSSSDFVEEKYWETVKGREDQVLLIPLHVINEEKEVNVKKLLERYSREQEEKARTDASPRSSKGKVQPKKFVLLSKEKVVDLHIEELLKDFSGMSNAQIIAYQLNYFLYEMDQAIINKVRKITFIHGVGQGVLKSAIREQLKIYPNIRFDDAPAEKFGYGATEIEFL